MRKMRSPIIIQVYDYGDNIRKRLTEIGVEFTERHIFSEFWGIQFTVAYPTGKGATKKVDEIWKLKEGKF